MNTACNAISEVACTKEIFSQFTIHKAVYHPCKATFNLSSYKPEKMKKRSFRKLGSIAYDSRMLSYRENEVSACPVGGRLKMPIVFHHPKHLPYIKGEGAAINQPEKSGMYSCSVQYLGLKPSLSALAVGG